MSHKTTRTLAAIATATIVALTTSAGGVDAAKKYSNCTALKKDFPNGVARDKAARNRQEFKPAVRRAIYLANAGLDRDKDGVACERG